MSLSERRSQESADPERFRSVIRSEVAAMQFQGDVRAYSRQPQLSGIQAGQVNALRYSGTGEQWGERNRRLIQSDHADYYVVCVPISARLSVRQNGEDVEVHHGSFVVVSTNRPYSARIRSDAADSSFSAIHVRVPGALLRRQFPNLDDLCGRENKVTPGRSRMMLSLFDIALNDGAYLAPHEREGLGDALMKAIGNVVEVLVDGSPQSRQGPSSLQRIFERARALIAASLSDHDLDPALVAEKCGVSTRYLHASFAAFSVTPVAQFIRESRLEACRQSLAHPAMRHRTIIDIASDWGFDDPAHFCRIYKTRFGKTPREDRSASLMA